MSPRRVDPKQKKQPQSGLPNWVIAVGIGVAVVVGVVGLFMLQTPVATTYTPSSVNSTGRTKGDPNANLELVVFSDFK